MRPDALFSELSTRPLVAKAKRVVEHSPDWREKEAGMAYGLIGGILGGDDDKSEAAAPAALAAAEAFAAAVAAKAYGAGGPMRRNLSLPPAAGTRHDLLRAGR